MYEPALTYAFQIEYIDQKAIDRGRTKAFILTYESILTLNTDLSHG